MKEVCVINYVSNAAVYGIGSYIKEYIFCIANLGNRINMIELGTDRKNSGIYIKEEENLRTIHIPYFHSKDFVKYNKGVFRLLRLYIEDSEELVFHFQYSNSYSMLESVKNHFPLSKSVFTIHYLHWSARLQGNITLFERIIRNSKNEKIKMKYGDIIENYNREKELLEKIDRIVCLSDDTFSLMQNHYDMKENVWLIPNGLRKIHRNLSVKQKINIRNKYYINPEEKILLFVGRIDHIKGLYNLFSCFEDVLQVYPNCRLVVTGDGDFNGVIKKCKNTYSKVMFTGRLNKKTLYQLYQIADIALFPSFYEECSYVGIEMMMHGLPIIASDGFNVKNMFHDGVNAKVAKIGNPRKPKEFENNLATAILELLDSETLCKELSKGARQIYESRYALKNMQDGYKKLLEDLDG